MVTEFRSPIIQAMNIIRHVGDGMSKTGEPIKVDHVKEIMQSPSNEFGESVINELCKRGLMRQTGPDRDFDGVRRLSLSLTFEGWEQYEAEQKGRLAGNYGFIALQFDDPELNEIVEHLKEQIRKELGYNLVHMLDVERPGIIDSIMRVQIRDSAFVIADLTHDNRGAYWEAGYAEGLGKPVLYICETQKFERLGTHFDTNHLTTIKWSVEEKKEFAERLIAALRLELESD